MKRVATVLAGVLVFAAAAGAAAKKPVVAVIPKGTTHMFWKSIHAGANKAAAELGVEVVWQGPQREDDRKMQIEVVQNFTSRGVAAIVLAPLDETALAAPVREAVKRKIPVVVIDSDLKGNEHASFVATDNYAGGKMAARRLAEVLGGSGTALMMRYAEGSASTMKREQGFLDGMKEYGPGVSLVSTNQYGGVTAESAFKTGQNLLNRFPTVNGIFCPNESTTFGMLRALQTAGRAGAVKFVGFDSSEPLIDGLKKGKIHGLVVQNPFKMGYLGVKTAVAAVRGEPVKKRIDTGVAIVTAETLHAPGVREAVFPDLKRWLGE